MRHHCIVAIFEGGKLKLIIDYQKRVKKITTRYKSYQSLVSNHSARKTSSFDPKKRYYNIKIYKHLTNELTTYRHIHK